ncbi:MAG: hypothetical protein Q8862_01360 [Bacteroidota bacterium]|nr:hypothetical protein [Bacteroidota bacterium]
MNTNPDKRIIADLVSQDPSVVLSALEGIAEKGNCSYISYLAELLHSSSNEEIKTRIIGILNDVKVKDAANELVALLQNKHYQTEWKTLSMCCWGNGLDYTPHLPAFVNIVISEPFETAFEAFTVIENMEGKTTQEQKDNVINKIKSAIPTISEDKVYLLQELIKIIDNIALAE